MNLAELQDKVKGLVEIQYHDDYQYAAIKLGGEAGETLNEIGKMIRERRWAVVPMQYSPRISKVEEELGDTLYYLVRVAIALNLDMEHIAQRNLDKIKGRKGVL